MKKSMYYSSIIGFFSGIFTPVIMRFFMLSYPLELGYFFPNASVLFVPPFIFNAVICGCFLFKLQSNKSSLWISFLFVPFGIVASVPIVCIFANQCL